MARYVALLRGINVGGHRKVRMEDLRAWIAAAGARDVATYIQSGNAVFAHPSRSAGKLAGELAAAIAKASKLDVGVIVRSADEWAEVIARRPFAGAQDDHLHVSFLAAAPPADALAALEAAKLAPEAWELVGRELYLYLPNGMGRSKLAAALARSKAFATATARNWRTVLQLRAMLATGAREDRPIGSHDRAGIACRGTNGACASTGSTRAAATKARPR